MQKNDEDKKKIDQIPYDSNIMHSEDKPIQVLLKELDKPLEEMDLKLIDRIVAAGETKPTDAAVIERGRKRLLKALDKYLD